jgi:hypothetical protein
MERGKEGAKEEKKDVGEKRWLNFGFIEFYPSTFRKRKKRSEVEESRALLLKTSLLKGLGGITPVDSPAKPES